MFPVLGWPRPLLLGGIALLAAAPIASAQFRDDFERIEGWNHFTGDGQATSSLTTRDGTACLRVDARADRRNIWWALIKRSVSDALDVAALARPGTELRIEARVKTDTAPRRINLHVNTQRTTDFHSHLKEFELAEANTWQTVSFTTRDFDARPGDQVFAQLALMDWGRGEYQLEIDYVRVDVVTKPGPDLGEPLDYHPEIPKPEAFMIRLPALHDSSVDRAEPGANLNDWVAFTPSGARRVLGVGATVYPLLRFDMTAFAGKEVAGGGLLELTTQSVHRRAERTKDFGLVRVVELIGGPADWDQKTITFERLLNGQPEERVINGQMVIDAELNDAPGGKTYLTISRPVLQRLVDGHAKGLIILPLGSIQAALVASEEGSPTAPALLFNLAE